VPHIRQHEFFEMRLRAEKAERKLESESAMVDLFRQYMAVREFGNDFLQWYLEQRGIVLAPKMTDADLYGVRP
jgi:predicted phosphoadenosine phosphosulfate sulfurtransferase